MRKSVRASVKVFRDGDAAQGRTGLVLIYNPLDVCGRDGRPWGWYEEESGGDCEMHFRTKREALAGARAAWGATWGYRIERAKKAKNPNRKQTRIESYCGGCGARVDARPGWIYCSGGGPTCGDRCPKCGPCRHRGTGQAGIGPHDGVTEWADCMDCGRRLDPTSDGAPKPWDGGCWYCGASASRVGLRKRAKK